MIHRTERSALTEKGTIYVEITASPIRDSSGKIIAGIEIVRDVTEHKKMDKKLKVMEWAIKSSINAIVLTDLETNLTYANPMFLKLWGYDKEEEVLGHHCTEFWQEKEKSKEIASALRKRGEWRGRRGATRRDGSAFMVEISASMVNDDAGEPICMMASMVDVTKQENMEKEINKRIKDLEEFYEIAVGREICMKELKEEVHKLEAELTHYRER